MLLRGVNVGGKRRVEMKRLSAMLSSLGFDDVVSYINSGNIVFSSSTAPSVEKIKAAFITEFGFEIDMLLLSGNQIRAVADAIPIDWVNDRTEWKADVLYLFDDVNSPDVLKHIHSRPEYEELFYVDHAVLSRIARKYQPKSSLLKIMGTDLSRSVTIRNVTTARKLAEMVQ